MIYKIKFIFFARGQNAHSYLHTGNKTRVPPIGIFIHAMSQLILANSHCCISDRSFEFL